MRFVVKNSTIVNYRKTLNKWTPNFWDEMKLEEFTRVDIHKLIFEDMLSSTPHQKKDVHKILRRFFEMAVEEGAINKNPAKGIKIKLPAPEQKILTSEEADKLFKRSSYLQPQVLSSLGSGLIYRDEKRRDIRP